MSAEEPDKRLKQEGSKTAGVEPSNEFEAEEWWLPTYSTRCFRMRFSDLIGKEPPIGMIFIDEAMHLLGRDLFPETWGMSTIWRQQPFRKDPGDRHFYRYRPHRNEQRGWYIRKVKTHGRYNPADLHDADEIYRRVITQFREGAERRNFVAQYAGRNDRLVSIGQARWSRNILSIFYTGFLFVGRFEVKPFGSSRTPVLIHANSFKDWRNSLQHKMLVKAKSTSLDHVVQRLAVIAEASQLRYTKSWLWDMCSNIALESDVELAEHQFSEAIWKSTVLLPYHAPPGKPTRDHQEARSKREPEVREAIKSL